MLNIRLNLFQTNGIFYKARYNLKRFIVYIKGSQVSVFNHNCSIFSLKYDFDLVYSADTDEMPHNAAIHLGLHFLLMCHSFVFLVNKRLNIYLRPLIRFLFKNNCL